MLGYVLSETGYEDQLRASRDPEDEERLANIEELLTVAREFDERHPGAGHLEAFLEETTLVNDTDDWETAADRVTLMTLHASKGLEFPVVYIVAVEEGLLPHERSREQPDQLEEERRLLFVGITRAQQELQTQHGPISRFPRPAQADRSQFVPDGTAARRHDAGGAGRGNAFLGIGEKGRGELAVEQFAQPLHDEPVFRDESRSGVAGVTPMMHLKTAAELARGGQPAPAPSPDIFQHGMLVRHPRYGLGRIVALSGSGTTRKATVDFSSPTGRKMFLLHASPLRPVKK